MKQITAPLSAIVAALLLALLALSALAGAALSLPRSTALAAPLAQTTPPAGEPQGSGAAGRSVQVSGSAVVNVVPDQAAVQLGVQSNAATVAEVEQANSAAIRNVIAALRGLGIAEKDISTDRYVVEPVYENYDALRIRGYRINNLVAITLRDVNQVRPAISAALQAGANQVVDVSFYSGRLRSYRDQARGLAMQAAGEKAAALAQAAGAQTGAVLTISENSWSYFNGMRSSSAYNQMAQNVVQNVAPFGPGGAAPGDEPISLGMISVRAEVVVTYALR